MTDHQYKDMSVHFTTAGSGDTVVMLHSGASSGAQWRKVGKFLEDKFYLLLPDLFGHGKTDPWPGPSDLTHDDNAALVHSVIKAECTSPVHLVGHSFGGACAVRFALAHPHMVRRLVLIEPIVTPLLKLDGQNEIFDEYLNMAETFLGYAKAGEDEAAWLYFIDYRNSPGTWVALSENAKQRFRAGTASVISAFTANLANLTTLEDCRSIAIPTLIICGEKTTEPDRRVTQLLHREIPNSDYAVISGAEHMSPLSHPKEVSAAIAAHLC